MGNALGMGCLMVMWWVGGLVVLGGLSLYVEALAQDWQRLAEKRPAWATHVAYLANMSSGSHYPYKHVRLWWDMCRHPEWQQQYDLPEDAYQHWLLVGGFYFSVTTLGMLTLLWWWML